MFITGLLAILLAGAHLCAAGVHIIADRHRRGWFSFAGGVAVGFIFIHVLPDLRDHGGALESLLPAGLAGREIYIIALVGVCAFYGLERLATRARRRSPPGEPEEVAVDHRVFWAHVGSFAIYNALVGYLLLHRDAHSTMSNILFAVALGLHLVVNDFALAQHHQDAYRRRGRWVLACAVLVGWGVGAAYSFPPAVVGGLFAFLAGGIVINVLKEELPEERKGRFGAFMAGVVVYSAILLATE